MLTKAQLERIVEIIRRRFACFTYEALGERALTSEELEKLKSLGLLRSSVRHLTTDGYALGKVVALVEKEVATRLSYEDVLAIAKRMSPVTTVEAHAMSFAADHAGQYIRGIADDIVKDVGGAAARSGMTALKMVQDQVSTAILERKTSSQLASDLFNTIDNRTRDWRRVAFTELHDAVQQGVYTEIREKSDEGADQFVYKKPAPDCCRWCRSLYLRADGITPKIFRLHELEVSNVGRKARDWRPVIGSTHPWCGCSLVVIPEGYDFAKKRSITEPFEDEGKVYKRGSIISEDEFSHLPVEHQAKVGFDAVLSFTGRTATPEVEKSSNVMDDGEGCICGY